MRLDPYRQVLANPGMRSLTVVALLARIPVTAAPVVLTLHVVLTLGLGFTQSGIAAAAIALGAAFGAPVLGRAIDRVGLRPVLVLTTGADAAFWLSAAWLPYRGLLVGAVVGGALSLPVFALVRQSLAAMLPPAQRQAGYALDSMSVELSFAVGPALGVVVLVQAGSVVALVSSGLLILVAGVALIVLDPPVHGSDGVPRAPADRARGRLHPAVPLRKWVGARAVAVLLATLGATLTLAGTDTALTAAMRHFDAVPLLGLVVAVWCLASLVGGFAYGGSGRQRDPLVLLAWLAGLTVLAGAAGSWPMLVLLVIPSGLFCAPLMAATAEALTRAAPVGSRGQAMGIHASALTTGNALGAPFVGVVVDRSTPGWGFVAIGVAGLALALVGLAAQAWRAGRSVRSPVAATAAPQR